MKALYRVREKSGMIGGRSYVADIRVQLDETEQNVISSYGALTSFDVGERFKEKNGVDILGSMRLESLTRGLEAKFSTIQQADDFVAAVMTGLKAVKQQIDATGDAASRLDQTFEVEF
jgi:hypothetical protein